MWVSENTLAKHLAATGLGLFFLNVGIAHFTDPAWFEPIVPPVLGDVRFWVYASGVVEILVGVGLLIPKTRRSAGMATAVTLVLLYWANLHMWVNDVPLDGRTFATHWHVLRGLAQIAMIAVALWVGHWIPPTVNDDHEQSSSSD
jgi:uncharacterized membrane protein